MKPARAQVAPGLSLEETLWTRLDLQRDSGLTKAEAMYQPGSVLFCLNFVRGCCAMGRNCRYIHRLPTREEAQLHARQNKTDLFGRVWSESEQEDLGEGVQLARHDNKCLYVGRIKNLTEQQLRNVLEQFGTIQELKFHPNRGFAFVTFEQRAWAEFAREAVREQLEGARPLTVRWAKGQGVGGVCQQGSKQDEAAAWEGLEQELTWPQGAATARTAANCTQELSLPHTYPTTDLQYPVASSGSVSLPLAHGQWETDLTAYQGELLETASASPPDQSHPVVVTAQMQPKQFQTESRRNYVPGWRRQGKKRQRSEVDVQDSNQQGAGGVVTFSRADQNVSQTLPGYSANVKTYEQGGRNIRMQQEGKRSLGAEDADLGDGSGSLAQVEVVEGTDAGLKVLLADYSDSDSGD
eukprot:gb/GEZN01009069.1/.p1 GENE.gb/GEZN01009069.1/~~gb/GEZN01009069.1/.p1  ORF type:complete len:410 (-),score=66.47 gb/GEZN01009069.1/:104-1333(-)